MGIAEIGAIVGSITGVVSLLCVIYGFGFKFGKMETKLDLLWSIDVEDALRRQRVSGLVQKQSPYALTTQAREKLESTRSQEVQKKVQAFIDRILPRLNHRLVSDSELAVIIVKHMGHNLVRKRCEELDWPISEYLATLITAIREVQGEGSK